MKGIRLASFVNVSTCCPLLVSPQQQDNRTDDRLGQNSIIFGELSTPLQTAEDGRFGVM
jgi:hypothetical protein